MPKVKRYKYKNIAAALAILLLIILGISTSCSSNADSPKKIPDSSSNSSAVKADSSSKKAVKKLTGNYMYVTAKNKTDMVKEGNMMSSEDVVEILAVDLIGVVPDDENIVISTNQGEPLVGKDCQAGQAYMNICHRILGEEVPYLNLEATNGLFQKLKSIFKK